MASVMTRLPPDTVMALLKDPGKDLFGEVIRSPPATPFCSMPLGLRARNSRNSGPRSVALVVGQPSPDTLPSLAR